MTDTRPRSDESLDLALGGRMPKRATYDVILVNLALDDENWWGQEIRAGIADLLTGWFKSVVAQSKEFKGAFVRCWWSSNKALLEDDELVVYFLARKQYSIVKRIDGVSPEKGE